jgi:3-hydroxyisobutyrate dehydrogenase
MRIGYIGLGDQGSGIADMVAESEHELVVWARRSGVTDRYEDRGATAAASPAELAAQCDIVGLCVTGDADVEALVVERGLLEAMHPGAALVIQSTVRPETVRAFGPRADQRGVHLLDAPVSGSGSAARQHKLLVMTGGTAAAVAMATPLFDTCAGTVVHCGGLGDAQIAKLINNGLFTANLKIIHDALQIGEQMGIDPDVLRTVLLAGSARSFGLEQYQRIFDLDQAAHAAALLRKDLGLLAALTSGVGVDPGDIVDLAGRVIDTVETYASGRV